jgi:hypothetical protein
MQWILIVWVSRTQRRRTLVPSRETRFEPELAASTSVH